MQDATTLKDDLVRLIEPMRISAGHALIVQKETSDDRF